MKSFYVKFFIITSLISAFASAKEGGASSGSSGGNNLTSSCVAVVMASAIELPISARIERMVNECKIPVSMAIQIAKTNEIPEGLEDTINFNDSQP